MREVLPDRLDPVRPPRGVGRDRLSPGRRAASARHRGRLPVRSRRRAGRAARRRSGLVLPVDRAARALRAARTRGLAGAGERGPGHAGRGRRRSARERGRGPRVRHGGTPRPQDTVEGGTGEPRARLGGRLEHGGEAAELASQNEPPGTTRGRETDWVADHDTETRDIRPALGTRGGPGSWTAAEPGAPVALARPDFGDARWSFLYKRRDTEYAAVHAGSRGGRGGEPEDARRAGLGDPRAVHPRARVELGSGDLLLVRRDGIRRGVRRARLRRRRRPPLRRDRPQGRARRRRARARPADRRSRPPRAIPEHDEDLQATLADEHGRLVPGRVQRLRRARGSGAT